MKRLAGGKRGLGHNRKRGAWKRECWLAVERRVECGNMAPWSRRWPGDLEPDPREAWGGEGERFVCKWQRWRPGVSPQAGLGRLKQKALGL